MFCIIDMECYFKGCAITTKTNQGYVYACKVLECKVTYTIISLKFQGENFFPEEKPTSILCPAGLSVFEQFPTVHGVYYAITIPLESEDLLRFTNLKGNKFVFVLVS